MKLKSPEEILLFWFSKSIKKLWFNSDLVFDQEVANLFGENYKLAVSGDLKDWEDNAMGALSLVLTLDQFPRNMFRGEKDAFATDALARQVATKAITKGLDKELGKQERAFLYMPFMHSENLEDQDKSIELFKALKSKENLEFAIKHKETIQKFGRFPHRNRILGRDSTAAELEYLKTNKGW